MTALNVFVQRQAVHVLTDGAGYAPDGSISWIGRKPITSDGLRAVIAWSGLGSPRQFADKLHMAAPNSQEALLQLLPSIAREFHSAGRHEAPDGDTGLQLVVAFFDLTRRCARALLLTTARVGFAAGLTPYKLHEVTHLTTPQIDVGQVLGRPVNTRTHLGFDVDNDGLAILEAQRLVRWDVGDERLSQVGGFGDRYTITADGISRAELIRWPDQVGQRIAA